jgi:hypothetical protein
MPVCASKSAIINAPEIVLLCHFLGFGTLRLRGSRGVSRGIGILDATGHGGGLAVCAMVPLVHQSVQGVTVAVDSRLNDFTARQIPSNRSVPLCRQASAAFFGDRLSLITT